jgi:putative ABC transport system permease protein
MNVGAWWVDLTVKPREGVSRDAAMDEVVATLRALRHLRPSQTNDFFSSTPEKLLQLYNKIVGVFFIVMITLSAIGLCVGGVGVVAIMMISVTERTREIGVRKAIGARRSDIIWQFLLEAMTLTASGGVIGIVLGWLLSLAVRTFVPSVPTTVPLWSVVAGFSVATSLGLFFGIWPAVKAARLDPIAALRHE